MRWASVAPGPEEQAFGTAVLARDGLIAAYLDAC